MPSLLASQRVHPSPQLLLALTSARAGGFVYNVDETKSAEHESVSLIVRLAARSDNGGDRKTSCRFSTNGKRLRSGSHDGGAGGKGGSQAMPGRRASRKERLFIIYKKVVVTNQTAPSELRARLCVTS